MPAEGQVRPFFVAVAALATLMAFVTFFEGQTLTASKANRLLPTLRFPQDSNSNNNINNRNTITRPMTNKELLSATRTVRKQIAGLAEAMEKNESWMAAPSHLEGDSIYSSMTLDISPIYDLVDAAIDTLGVKGVYFGVFYDGELDWWFEGRPEQEEHWNCWETHGTHLCPAYEPWWFYHYIGAITAEKLLGEGSVLWDPVTGERVETMLDLLHRIHDKMAAAKDWIGDMSFHAQHALLWHYAEVMLPDIDSYPVQMAKDMCGDEYAYRKISQSNNGKQVGRECFHGMGHAIFYVIARQQMKEDLQKQQLTGKSQEGIWTARTQFRPSAGLELTQDSWCKIYKYCQTDLGIKEGYNVDVSTLCIGGARHSVRIFARDDDMRWHYKVDKKKRNEFFDVEMDKCRQLEESTTKR